MQQSLICPFWQKKRVAVLGLGLSGVSAVHALVRSGAEVLAYDDDISRHDAIAHLPEVMVTNLENIQWQNVRALVLSPGIPHTWPHPHPAVKQAKAHKVPIIGDTELLAKAEGTDAAFIGITGTNGKSTTTTLLGHIFNECKRRAVVGGNLGTPVMDLPPIRNGGSYILEMSSYQLELTHSLTFDTAVLLNMSPDHLDRHRNMRGYREAKMRIFHHQNKKHTAVIGVDDRECDAVFTALTLARRQNIIPISGRKAVEGGVYAKDGVLIDDRNHRKDPLTDLTNIRSLSGSHNWQNAAAAFVVATTRGIPADHVITALRSFPGLVHRQEWVAEIDGIDFINDSKATNANSTLSALSSFKNMYLILGGVAKAGGVNPLLPHLENVKGVFLVGESEERFARDLEGHARIFRCGNLDRAVMTAYDHALREGHESPVVLLSPACASFDQYANFEARGDAFREKVLAMKKKSEPLSFTLIERESKVA